MYEVVFISRTSFCRTAQLPAQFLIKFQKFRLFSSKIFVSCPKILYIFASSFTSLFHFTFSPLSLGTLRLSFLPLSLLLACQFRIWASLFMASTSTVTLYPHLKTLLLYLVSSKIVTIGIFSLPTPLLLTSKFPTSILLPHPHLTIPLYIPVMQMLGSNFLLVRHA